MNNVGVPSDTWLAELFEFEDCDECGKGEEDHEVCLFFGNWFARCRSIDNGS